MGKKTTVLPQKVTIVGNSLRFLFFFLFSNFINLLAFCCLQALDNAEVGCQRILFGTVRSCIEILTAWKIPTFCS